MKNSKGGDGIFVIQRQGQEEEKVVKQLTDVLYKYTMLDKKVVMIIAPVDFRDEELYEPKTLLEREGVDVTIASTSATVCSGMLGKIITPHILITDIKVAEYDAIIFVGGKGATCYWDDPLAHKIIHDAVQLNKIIAAICIAPVTLANAGILRGKKATVWKTEENKLIAKGALYTGNRVEYDGKIITANGPDSATQFARSVIKELQTV